MTRAPWPDGVPSGTYGPRVQAPAVAHLAETSWRQGGKRAWFWVAVTSWVTVFVVRLSRGGSVARELLGETFTGIVVTDR